MIADGVVYIGSFSGHLYAIEQRTWREKWNFKSRMSVASSPAVRDGTLHVGTSDSSRPLALDAKTGKLAWEFQPEAARQNATKVLNPDGSLNQAGFAPVFGDFQDMYVDSYRCVSIGAIMSSPAVDRGVLYVGSMDGNLYALQ